MKRLILFIFLYSYVTFQSKGQINNDITNPVQYVNPLMGTQSFSSISNGSTYPAIGRPWGMNLWTPQTGDDKDGRLYQYTDHKISGFKQTHQPSHWMGDYGVFSIFPVSGELVFEQKKRASWYSHKTETVTPYFYKVYLADHDVWAEMTATTRAAQFIFTFPKSDSSYIIVDAYDRGSYIKILPKQQKIIGYSTRNRGGVAKNFKNYFVIHFDHLFASVNTWHGKQLAKDTLEYKGNHVGAIVGFKTTRGEKIHLKVASSFISFNQAELNLKREIGGNSFAETKQHGKEVWNKKLSRIKVSGGTIDQVRTFYSCLYRMLFFPLKLYEINDKGQVVHYSPYNGEVRSGYMFGGTGFWDTFRALYPFLTLMYPDINVKMQKGLVNDFQEGGYLPEWSAPGYRNAMIGNNSASVVAGAYLKGLRGYAIDTLFKSLIKDANTVGHVSAVGREGYKYYNKLGYVPYDVEINESAARTLEYAYDDYAIYALGKALNKPESEIAVYAKRCQNYKNVFDSTHNLMRGRNKDGSFESPFNPLKWGDAFTEGNSWHYSWSVFHDIQGLINLMGGEKIFVTMLDSIFIMPPIFDGSYYGGAIHLIREMQTTGMGQYAHGNEPIQHMIYLYNYARQPWKAQYWVRQAMDRLYMPTPDGYCGDEDNGQTSAWYVFSAMGFYPVCPASTQYVFGAPLFKKITLNLENGNQFAIIAPDNSKKNVYIHRMWLNGEVYNKNWIDHFDILKGGTLKIEMDNEPNKTRGTNKKAAPFSFSRK